jgi:tripartite-type tricarboxylate transporter receptor subunit TctC
MRTKLTRRAAVATLFALGLAPAAAFAQDYPKQKPITLIVAQAAGSATDQMARILSAKLSSVLGQQIVIDNRAGGGGVIGSQMVADAAPDGYTLLLASISTHGINPALYKTLPYKAVEGFTPIGWTGFTANLIVVNAELPVKTLAELVEYSKKNPDKLTVATAGNGSSQHLATELLKARTGMQVLHVPYKGSGPMSTAVMSGEASWMMPAIPTGLTAVRSGKVRPLAVSSKARSAKLPDVPTIAETVADYEVTTWYGLMGPAKLPANVVETLNAAIKTSLADPDVRAKLEAAGLEGRFSTPAEFGEFVKAEIDRWTKVAADANIKAD